MVRASGQRIVPLEARLRSAKRRSGTKLKAGITVFSLSADAFQGPPPGTIRCPDA